VQLLEMNASEDLPGCYGNQVTKGGVCRRRLLGAKCHIWRPAEVSARLHSNEQRLFPAQVCCVTVVLHRTHECGHAGSTWLQCTTKVTVIACTWNTQKQTFNDMIIYWWYDHILGL